MLHIGIKQIKRELFLIFILLFAIVFSVLAKSGFAFLVVEILLLIYCFTQSGVVSIEYYILLTIVQNIVLVLLAPYISSMTTNLIIIIKECIIYIGALKYWIKNKFNRINKIDVWFILFCMISVLSIVVNKINIYVGLYSLRQFLVPFLCYYFGCGIEYKDKNKLIKEISRFLIYISIIVAIVSWMIYTKDPDTFWTGIGYKEYYLNKYNTLKSFSTMNFYTFDLGYRMKRFTSIFVDPLAFAHFVVVPILILLYGYKRQLGGLKIFFILTACVCLSKYHVIVLAVIVFIFFYQKSKSQAGRAFYKVVMIACVGVIFVMLSNYSSSLTENTSIGNHFNSFSYGLENISLLGKGIGSGSWTAYATGAANIVEGDYGESLFSTMMVQVGVLGLIPFYVFIAVILLKLYRVYSNNLSPQYIICFILILSVCIETLVSASSISMLGTGIYFILAGVVSNMLGKENYG